MVYSVCCLVLPEPTPPSKPEPVQKPAREPAKPSPAASTDTRGKHILSLSLSVQIASHISTLTHFLTSQKGASVLWCLSADRVVSLWAVPLWPHYKAWKSPSLLLSLAAAWYMCALVVFASNTIMIAGLLYRNTEDLIPKADKSALFLFFSFTVMTSRLFLFILLFIPFAYFCSLSSLLLFCSVSLSYSLCEIVCPSLLPATQHQTQGLWVCVAVVTAGGGIAMETIMRGR